MGWFWADAQPARPRPSHPVSQPGAEPPPGCPMHQTLSSKTPSSKPSACPVKHDSPASTPASSPSYVSKLNPLNYMPSNISNTRDADQQSVRLSVDREASTIPRGDGPGNWDYPSPQQMYNAMLRKGYTDTPAEHVEAMVAVHNFLNEGAWEEIKEWERRFGAGLWEGWENCRAGEEGAVRQAAPQRLLGRADEEQHEPRLLRFMGRPGDLTPKARMLGFLAQVWPSQFPDNPPFDRHDWYVQRNLSGGRTREVRYVIDYYSGPPEPTGEPVFYLDVRPAVDGPTAACERAMRWGGDIWWRASGGSAREQLARQRSRA